MILSNIFSSSRYIKEPYNYEAGLIGNVRMGQLLKIVETSLEVCPHCLIRKRNHYCIEQSCRKRELICPECDVKQINQGHYLHDYSYLLPFLSKDIFTNFYRLKKKIVSFHDDIKAETKKIEDYLKELYKVEGTVKKQIRIIEEEEDIGQIKDYLEKMTEFVANYRQGEKLKEKMSNVLFLSAQQCQKREEEMKT
jgi:hypothetical protein